MRHFLCYTTIFLLFFSPVFSQPTQPGNAAAASSQTGANSSWQDWFFPAASVFILGIGLTVVGLNQGSPPDTSTSH